VRRDPCLFLQGHTHTHTQNTSRTGDVGNQNDLALPVRHVADVAIDIFGRELRERRLVRRLGLCTDVPHSLDARLASTSSVFVCTLRFEKETNSIVTQKETSSAHINEIFYACAFVGRVTSRAQDDTESIQILRGLGQEDNERRQGSIEGVDRR